MQVEYKPLGGKNGVAKVISGATPSTDMAEFWNGDILWSTPTDVGRLTGMYLLDTERKITEAGFRSCSTKIVPKGSILLTSRAPVGNLCITLEDTTINQGMKGIVPNEGIDAHYLLFYLMSKVKDMQADSHGNTFTELPKAKLETIMVPVVSIDEQIRLVANLKNDLLRIERIEQIVKDQVKAVTSLKPAKIREFVNQIESKS